MGCCCSKGEEDWVAQSHKYERLGQPASGDYGSTAGSRSETSPSRARRHRHSSNSSRDRHAAEPRGRSGSTERRSKSGRRKPSKSTAAEVTNAYKEPLPGGPTSSSPATAKRSSRKSPGRGSAERSPQSRRASSPEAQPPKTAPRPQQQAQPTSPPDESRPRAATTSPGGSPRLRPRSGSQSSNSDLEGEVAAAAAQRGRDRKTSAPSASSGHRPEPLVVDGAEPAPRNRALSSLSSTSANRASSPYRQRSLSEFSTGRLTPGNSPPGSPGGPRARHGGSSSSKGGRTPAAGSLAMGLSAAAETAEAGKEKVARRTSGHLPERRSRLSSAARRLSSGAIFNTKGSGGGAGGARPISTSSGPPGGGGGGGGGMGSPSKFNKDLLRRRVSTHALTFMDQFAKCKQLTSTQYMRIFNHYDRDCSGTINVREELGSLLRDLVKIQDLQPLRLDSRMQTMVAEGHEVTEEFMEEYKASVLEFVEATREEGEAPRRGGGGAGAGDIAELDMKTLAQILPVEDNFLLRFDHKEVLSRVEFCSIWFYYDDDRNGFIEAAELEGLLRDLLQKHGKTASAELLAEYKRSILNAFDDDGDGKLNFVEMENILPVEPNFLFRFEGQPSFTRADVEAIFRHYNESSNGSLHGVELDAFLFDLLVFNREPLVLSEIAEYRVAVLDMCDTNRNGKVEMDELMLLLFSQQV